MNQFIPSVIRGFLSEKLQDLHHWLQRGIADKSYQPVLIPVRNSQFNSNRNNQ